MLRIFSCNLSKMAHLEDVVTLQALHSSFNVLVSFMFYGELSDLYSLETFWFKLNFNLLVRLLCVLLSKKQQHTTTSDINFKTLASNINQTTAVLSFACQFSLALVWVALSRSPIHSFRV